MLFLISFTLSEVDCWKYRRPLPSLLSAGSPQASPLCFRKNVQRAPGLLMTLLEVPPSPQPSSMLYTHSLSSQTRATYSSTLVNALMLFTSCVPLGHFTRGFLATTTTEQEKKFVSLPCFESPAASHCNHFYTQ